MGVICSVTLTKPYSGRMLYHFGMFRNKKTTPAIW